MELISKLRIMQHVIGQLDDITDRLAEQRFMLEMFRRYPEKGNSRDGRTMMTADQVLNSITALETERKDVLPILYSFTNADSEEEARETYMDVLSAYQRWFSLKEQFRLRSVGYSLEELDNRRFNGTMEELETMIDKAKTVLDKMAENLTINEPSNLVLPSASKAISN